MMGLKYSVKEHVKKGYDGVNAPNWNPEVEPFDVQWVVQKEENMCVLGVVEDHMPP